MDSSDSKILGLNSTGSYPTALSTLIDEMSLQQRSNLIFLDTRLHELWGLGQNVILNWCPEGDGIAILAVPHYSVATYSNVGSSGEEDETQASRPSENFFKMLIRLLDLDVYLGGRDKSFSRLKHLSSSLYT